VESLVFLCASVLSVAPGGAMSYAALLLIMGKKMSNARIYEVRFMNPNVEKHKYMVNLCHYIGGIKEDG
jgi:hypothetical protein